jgi:hypothetical protein
VFSVLASACTRALVSLFIIYSFVNILFSCFSASFVCLCCYSLSHVTSMSY